MDESPHYRHEIKQLLSPIQYYLLKNLLEATMIKDVHSSNNGSYFIRSFYFDDIFDSALEDKRSGISTRKKYRIRFYNMSNKQIHLECKQKIGTRICKTSVPISEQCASLMIFGDFSLLETMTHPLAKEVFVLSKAKALSSKIIVDYEREAYCLPISNIRLTFDKSIVAREVTHNLFQSDSRSKCILNDHIIFEIKYDDFIPTHIQQILSNVNGEKIALSKYTMCRDELSTLLGHENYGGLSYE